MRNKLHVPEVILERGTKTSLFIRFLLKICFIPLKTRDDVLVFKFFSLKTLMFGILYVGSYFAFAFVSEQHGDPPEFSDINNFSKIVANISLGVTTFFIAYPLSLAIGMNNLEKDFLLNKRYTWAKGGRNLMIGGIINIIGYFLNYFDVHNLATIGVVLLSNIFWITPCLVVIIIIQNFEIKYKQQNHLSIHIIKEFINDYKQLQNGLSKFLLIFYFFSQCSAITYTFSITSQYFQQKSKFTALEIQKLLVNLSLVFVVTIVLHSITTSVSSAFDVIQEIQDHIYEKLSHTHDNEEKMELEYCKNLAQKLRPLNAEGYFEIDKTTLTSMLSVRYLSIVAI